MKKIFIKIKKTKIWFFFLLYIFNPFFNFMWKNVINFQSRLIYIYFKKKQNKNDVINYLNHSKNDKLIIKNSPELKNLAEKINLDLNESFIKKMKSKINDNKKYNKDHYLYSKPNFQIDMFPFIKEDLKEEIIKTAINSFLIHRASTYLGVMPILGKLSLNLNIPVDNFSERGSMLWHKDDFGYKTVDFFIPIRDVNLENGPLYFTKKKNPLGVFYKYTNVKQFAKKGERNKITLDEFDQKVGSNAIDIFTGKPGDALMIDSFSSYHRGGYCKSSNRIMLRITFHTPDSIDMLDKKNLNGVFRYCNTFYKEDKKLSKVQKHILFYRPKFFYKLKIPEFLIFVYKIFHYKE